jgi:hypothetical protein
MGLLALLVLAGLWAGVQNTLAGGGSFVTLPALIVGGMTPLAANVTSTVALFPGQVTSAYGGRRLVAGAGAGGLTFAQLVAISVVGGAVGGLTLLSTPSALFARLVPWLVLFATGVFAWGSFAHASLGRGMRLGVKGAALAQFAIAVYGGYFGGGIGFLMMAAFTMAGTDTRRAVATKNVLAAVMNASAVLLFALSPQVHWTSALALGAGAIAGGAIGAWAVRRVSQAQLRVGIVVLGAALTVGLFLRPI